jgi:hypothetical protein
MESAITGDIAGDWSGLQDHDAQVMDHVTDGWTDDLDLSLEPAPQRVAGPPTRPQRSGARWALALLAVVGLVGVLGLGTALVTLVAALVVAGAVVMIPVATFPEASVDEVGVEMVTPVIVDVPATVVPVEVEAPTPAAPAARKPVAAAPKKAEPKASAPAADEGRSDAKLVVMPDPAFRGMPADQAIERLKKKVEKGEAGTVVGR